MDDDHDLRNFSGLARLFPLPRLVTFPHAVLPLHIFEPRYRQMTEDALSGDRLVTMVQLRTPGSGPGPTLGAPPIEVVGCLGRIIQHERLPDGRFNMLLLGRRRVRLVREVSAGTPYRVAEAEVIEDVEGDPAGSAGRTDLIALFRRAFEGRQALDPDMAALLEAAAPLGVLTDIMAHALGLPPGLKQRLLAEPRVDRRVDTLIDVLRGSLSLDPGEVVDAPAFPPPFSAN